MYKIPTTTTKKACLAMLLKLRNRLIIGSNLFVKLFLTVNLVSKAIVSFVLLFLEFVVDLFRWKY